MIPLPADIHAACALVAMQRGTARGRAVDWGMGQPRSIPGSVSRPRRTLPCPSESTDCAPYFARFPVSIRYRAICRIASFGFPSLSWSSARL